MDEDAEGKDGALGEKIEGCKRYFEICDFQCGISNEMGISVKSVKD